MGAFIAVLLCLGLFSSCKDSGSIDELGDFEEDFQSADLDEGDAASETLDFGISKSKLGNYASYALFGAVGLVLFLVVFNTVRRAQSIKKQMKKEQADDEQNKKKRGESGQAMVEFVLIFPVVLLLTTGIMQISLLKCARMLMSYAAFNAVRSAIVWIPVEIDGEEQGENFDAENHISNDYDSGNVKMTRIRRAAQLSLIPAGSSHHSFFNSFNVSGHGDDDESAGDGGAFPIFTDDSIVDYLPEYVRDAFVGVLSSLGETATETFIAAIARRYAYTTFFSDVVFLDEMGSEVHEFTVADRQPLTAQVKMLYHLRIPIASAVIGKHMDFEMARAIRLGERSDAGPGFVFDDISDDQNYYTLLTEKSTLLVERKFNHANLPW